ncbi:unnamed protein product [Ambrosiozyma monospora]|uniref:Unnamed protein product n=1 Tax=Ambrosiozyma monospora TaxID=43982 RepID=A0ACB5STB5_AMBMO|nr:unnamed protein product [Ambrosiozyma monospora]
MPVFVSVDPNFSILNHNTTSINDHKRTAYPRLLEEECKQMKYTSDALSRNDVTFNGSQEEFEEFINERPL